MINLNMKSAAAATSAIKSTKQKSIQYDAAKMNFVHLKLYSNYLLSSYGNQRQPKVATSLRRSKSCDAFVDCERIKISRERFMQEINQVNDKNDDETHSGHERLSRHKKNSLASTGAGNFGERGGSCDGAATLNELKDTSFSSLSSFFLSNHDNKFKTINFVYYTSLITKKSNKTTSSKKAQHERCSDLFRNFNLDQQANLSVNGKNKLEKFSRSNENKPMPEADKQENLKGLLNVADVKIIVTNTSESQANSKVEDNPTNITSTALLNNCANSKEEKSATPAPVSTTADTIETTVAMAVVEVDEEKASAYPKPIAIAEEQDASRASIKVNSFKGHKESVMMKRKSFRKSFKLNATHATNYILSRLSMKNKSRIESVHNELDEENSSSVRHMSNCYERLSITNVEDSELDDDLIFQENLIYLSNTNRNGSSVRAGDEAVGFKSGNPLEQAKSELAESGKGGILTAGASFRRRSKYKASMKAPAVKSASDRHKDELVSKIIDIRTLNLNDYEVNILFKNYYEILFGQNSSKTKLLLPKQNNNSTYNLSAPNSAKQQLKDPIVAKKLGITNKSYDEIRSNDDFVKRAILYYHQHYLEHKSKLMQTLNKNKVSPTPPINKQQQQLTVNRPLTPSSSSQKVQTTTGKRFSINYIINKRLFNLKNSATNKSSVSDYSASTKSGIGRSGGGGGGGMSEDRHYSIMSERSGASSPINNLADYPSQLSPECSYMNRSIGSQPTSMLNANAVKQKPQTRYNKAQKLITSKVKNLTLAKKLSKFSREQKAAKTLGIVMGVFIICWLPFFIYNVATGIFKAKLPKSHEILYTIFTWLGYINSGCNPIIYAFSSRDFRKAFYKILFRTNLLYNKRMYRRDQYNAPTSSWMGTTNVANMGLGATTYPDVGSQSRGTLTGCTIGDTFTAQISAGGANAGATTSSSFCPYESTSKSTQRTSSKQNYVYINCAICQIYERAILSKSNLFTAANALDVGTLKTTTTAIASVGATISASALPTTTIASSNTTTNAVVAQSPISSFKIIKTNITNETKLVTQLKEELKSKPNEMSSIDEAEKKVEHKKAENDSVSDKETVLPKLSESIKLDHSITRLDENTKQINDNKLNEIEIERIVEKKSLDVSIIEESSVDQSKQSISAVSNALNSSTADFIREGENETSKQNDQAYRSNSTQQSSRPSLTSTSQVQSSPLYELISVKLNRDEDLATMEKNASSATPILNNSPLRVASESKSSISSSQTGVSSPSKPQINNKPIVNLARNIRSRFQTIISQPNQNREAEVATLTTAKEVASGNALKKKSRLTSVKEKFIIRQSSSQSTTKNSRACEGNIGPSQIMRTLSSGSVDSSLSLSIMNSTFKKESRYFIKPRLAFASRSKSNENKSIREKRLLHSPWFWKKSTGSQENNSPSASARSLSPSFNYQRNNMPIKVGTTYRFKNPTTKYIDSNESYYFDERKTTPRQATISSPAYSYLKQHSNQTNKEIIIGSRLTTQLSKPHIDYHLEDYLIGSSTAYQNLESNPSPDADTLLLIKAYNSPDINIDSLSKYARMKPPVSNNLSGIYSFPLKQTKPYMAFNSLNGKETVGQMRQGAFVSGNSVEYRPAKCRVTPTSLKREESILIIAENRENPTENAIYLNSDSNSLNLNGDKDDDNDDDEDEKKASRERNFTHQRESNQERRLRYTKVNKFCSNNPEFLI
jgi:hypothetical protein